MDIIQWNDDIKRLREMISKPDKFEDSKKLVLALHSMVHASTALGIGIKTFEDELWEDLNEDIFRNARSSKGHTIAFGMWHCTRIEDITMNLLVTEEGQVFSKDNWQEKINSVIVDTGNSLSEEDIIGFSKNINMDTLRNYRNAVARRSRDIICELTAADMKRKFTKQQLQRILDEGAVLNVEATNWLIDFWGRKNVAGILLMPVTRHNLVHINESIRAKNKRLNN